MKHSSNAAGVLCFGHYCGLLWHARPRMPTGLSNKNPGRYVSVSEVSSPGCPGNRSIRFCLDYKTKKLRNYAKLSEVSSGFEPEYTVLQTGA